MTITIKFENGDKLGRRFQEQIKNYTEKRIKAIQAAANRAAEEIVSEGQADIRAGGNFGSDRWQNGLHAKVSFESRSDINIRVTHDVFFWKVFEFGATINGKPLLWIPLSFARDAQGVRARDYPGKLFRVNRKSGGAPLLMAGGGRTAEPKYFGKEQVTIPRKFHLRAICKAVSRRLPEFYREAFNNG